MLAVNDAGDVVGASWYRQPRAGSIPKVFIAVKSDHRGQGVGRELFAANVAQAVKAEIPALHAVVKPDNYASRQLLADYDARLRLDNSPRALEYLIVLDDRLVVL